VEFPEIKALYYPKSVEGNCSRVDTLKFGLNFTTDDDGAEIKCIIKNSELGITTESIPQSLELVPSMYCLKYVLNINKKITIIVFC